MLNTSNKIKQLLNIDLQQEHIQENKKHNLVDWWFRLNSITPEEHALINKPCNYNKITSINSWETLQELVRMQLPYEGGFVNEEWERNLEGYHLYLGKSATDLINKICDKHIKDDVLVITSIVEHPAVKDAVERLGRTNKDHVILDYINGIQNLNISQVIEACENKKYKKAFVMIIGTQVTTGEVTPQKFFIKLKDYLESQGIETVMAIDDAQGMYLVPRNYNIFDYVIYTAHTLVREHLMGMLWSKEELDFGMQYAGWLSQYYKKLKVMLRFQEKYNSFSDVMKDELREYLYTDYVNYVSDSVPYIFSVKVDCPPRFIYDAYTADNWLLDYEVKLENADYLNDECFYIKLRAAQYITTPEKLTIAIPKIKAILDKVIDYKENSND